MLLSVQSIGRSLLLLGGFVVQPIGWSLLLLCGQPLRLVLVQPIGRSLLPLCGQPLRLVLVQPIGRSLLLVKLRSIGRPLLVVGQPLRLL